MEALSYRPDDHDRDTWRPGVRSAMRAASQLPGRGPTVVDMAPIPKKYLTMMIMKANCPK